MNLLFTSAGRRKYLVDYFLTVDRLGGDIHVANSDPFCAAFAATGIKKLVTPSIYSEEYLPFLVDYCANHQIDALISLFDADLPVLSRSRAEFGGVGTKVIVADPEQIEICNDKWRNVQFVNEIGLRAPRTFPGIREAGAAIEDGEVGFPLIVKPRWGMGSIGLESVGDRQALAEAWSRVGDKVANSYLKFESSADRDACVLIQEQIRAQEYGLDVVNDLDGNHITTCVKRKLAMRAGETDAAETIDLPRLQELGATVAGALRHPGNLDIDVFWDGTKATVLEMNARFGGGYPFSHLAGMDLPRAIIHWIRGEVAPPECFAWSTGVVGVKALVPERLL